MSNILSISAPVVNSGKWLITDVIAKNRLSIIVGDNHKLNCSVANMISSCLVTEEPLFGKKVRTKGSVLYAGSHGHSEALRSGRDLNFRAYSDELLVTDSAINLLNQQQIRKLVKQLNKPDGLIRKGLSLIVLELSSFKFLDPIESIHVANTINNLNYILENTGVSILLVQTEGSARRLGIRVLMGMATVAIKLQHANYWHDKNDCDIVCIKANDEFLISPIKFGRMKLGKIGVQS